MQQVMSNGRVRRTEAEWREMVSRFRTSGMSVREFCRKERLKVSSLQRWQGRLKEAGVRQDFVAVVPTAVPIGSSRTWVVEVTLPDGSQLRFQG
jgi:hypothetical protein